jgi:hypothetical protein
MRRASTRTGGLPIGRVTRISFRWARPRSQEVLRVDRECSGGRLSGGAVMVSAGALPITRLERSQVGLAGRLLYGD